MAKSISLLSIFLSCSFLFLVACKAPTPVQLSPTTATPPTLTAQALTPAPSNTPLPPTAAVTLAPPTATGAPPTATLLPPDATITETTLSAPQIVPIPSPAPTAGAVSQFNCGGYTISQTMGLVLGTAQTVSVTITDPQGNAKTLTPGADQTVSFLQLQCGDFTGAGAQNLLIESYTGGAHCCFVYNLLALASGYPSLFHWNAGNGGITRIALLRGHRPYEIVGTDDRFAYFDSLPFAASPVIPVVFAFRSGQYVNATRDYPETISADQAQAYQDLGKCTEDICQQELALKIYADGVLLNQGAKTLNDLQGSLSAAAYTWLGSVQADADKQMAK